MHWRPPPPPHSPRRDSVAARGRVGARRRRRRRTRGARRSRASHSFRAGAGGLGPRAPRSGGALAQRPRGPGEGLGVGGGPSGGPNGRGPLKFWGGNGPSGAKRPAETRPRRRVRFFDDPSRGRRDQRESSTLLKSVEAFRPYTQGTCISVRLGTLHRVAREWRQG